MTALRSLQRTQDEIASLKRKLRRARARAREEARRLSRTKHRKQTLRHLYWDRNELFTVGELADVFRVAVAEVAREAGPVVVSTTCLLCLEEVDVQVNNRSALKTLETEAGSSPEYRICPNCTAFRELDLAVLRRKKGERLDGIHLAAYKSYLASPQWRETRAKALRRAKHRCQLCGAKRDLAAHHRHYENIGREKPGDLIVLCRPCHSRFHDVA